MIRCHIRTGTTATILSALLSGCSVGEPNVTAGQVAYFEPTTGLREHRIPDFEEFQRRSRVWNAPGELYLVQRDIPIYSAEKLRAYYDEAIAGKVPKLIAYNDGYGNPAKIPNGGQLALGYCVSTDFAGYSNGVGGTMYDTIVGGMDIASRAWGEGGNIWFRHVASADSNCEALPSGVYVGILPWDADNAAFGCNDGNYICFNPTAQQSAESASATLSHESGHMLGFDHENYHPDWEDACPASTTDIVLTPHFDPDSIMLAPQGMSSDEACYPDPPGEVDEFGVFHPYQLPFWCYCADAYPSSEVSAGDRAGAMVMYGVPAWITN